MFSPTNFSGEYALEKVVKGRESSSKQDVTANSSLKE